MKTKVLRCGRLSVLVLMALLLCSYGLFAGGQKEKTTSAEKEGIVIGFAPHVYDASDYFGQFDAAMRDVLEQEGISYKVKGRAPLNSADLADHMNIVEDFVTIGVDYIIFGPVDPSSVIPAIRSANEAGIPLIIMNHIEPLPEDAGVEVLTYTGYSHRTGGEITGKWIVDNLLKSGDEAAILFGSPGHTASEARGFPAKEAMEKAGINVVYEQNTDWLASTGYDIVERVLVAHPNIKLIYGVNSALAMGSAEAVVAAGLKGKVDVIGFGCITPEIDMIWEGLIKGSIFRDAASNGRQAAEAIIKHMQGKEVPIQYGMDLILVSTRDDILEKIPIIQLEPTKNWPEMEKELKKRGKL